MSNISSHPSGRLASLDVLRGFDLFLLVFLQPVLWGLLSQWESPLAQALLFQLDHEIWEGFRCWDLVMPLFLFMSGISMPFALSKYLRDECPRGEALRKVLRRFVILFLLGMVVQGNLLWLKWEYVQPFTNTLQAIAVGYLVTALILLSRLSLGRQMLVAVGLLAAYTIPMMWVGDYTLEGNLACRIDAYVVGEVVNFRSIVESVSYGLAEPLGSYYTVWLTFGNFLLLLLILALMYRARIFVKV